MIYPSSLKVLIESFKKLPGIGEKTAERLAFAVIDLDEKSIEQFSTSLMNTLTAAQAVMKAITKPIPKRMYSCELK